MEENTYSIYKFTFSNGKVYIGQTNQKVEDRWKNGEGYRGQDVYVAIVLDGWNNVKKEILHTGLTSKQADELEKHYIKKFNSIKEGYNRSAGGISSTERILDVNLDYDLNFFNAKILPALLNELKPCSLKLFLYLLSCNKQKIKFSFSSLYKESGVSKRGISNGWTELIEKNFLIETQSNYFIVNIERFK